MKIAIIGAGAAGLMCACMLPTEYSVVVFDGNESVGKPIISVIFKLSFTKRNIFCGFNNALVTEW